MKMTRSASRLGRCRHGLVIGCLPAMLTMGVSASAANADKIVVTLEADGVDPNNLRPGQNFDVLVSLSADRGREIESIRWMQFDHEFTKGSSVDDFEWDIQGINDARYFKEVFPGRFPNIVRAIYMDLQRRPGFILDLMDIPTVVGRYTVTFHENGELNLIGDPDPPGPETGIFFMSGFPPNEVEYRMRDGNILGGGLRLRSSSCPDKEACCLPDYCGEQCEMLCPDTCIQGGGVPQGPGSECNGEWCQPPMEGACCFPDGNCEWLCEDECFGRDGEFYPEKTCQEVDCPSKEACCFPDGSCEELFEEECHSRGGKFYPGETCQSVDCEPLSQACCFPDGSCQDMLPDECKGQGGTPEGPDTECDTVDCPFDCDLINRLKLKCKGKPGKHKVNAIVKSELAQGVELTLSLDGGDEKIVTIKPSGKAKAKWKKVGSGEHEVCIKECPDLCRRTTCGS